MSAVSAITAFFLLSTFLLTMQKQCKVTLCMNLCPVKKPYVSPCDFHWLTCDWTGWPLNKPDGIMLRNKTSTTVWTKENNQLISLLPFVTALSLKPWVNITNYPLVQTLLINGAGRPGLRELTKQTRHGALLYLSIPGVFLQGCERLVVWVRSMAHRGPA